MADNSKRLAELRAAREAREEKERADAEAAELAELERGEKVSAALDFWRDKGIKDVSAHIFSGDGGHFFIVTAPGAEAWRTWNKAIGDATAKAVAKSGTLDTLPDNAAATRAYVIEGVLQHNDTILDPRGGEVDSDNGVKANEFLKSNPQIVNHLKGAIDRMNNVLAEERKS